MTVNTTGDGAQRYGLRCELAPCMAWQEARHLPGVTTRINLRPGLPRLRHKVDNQSVCGAGALQGRSVTVSPIRPKTTIANLVASVPLIAAPLAEQRQSAIWPSPSRFSAAVVQ